MKLPARPKIRLFAPDHLVPGTDAMLSVELATPRATPVDYVDLSLVGYSGINEPNLRLGARLCGAGELAKGKTNLRCRVPLPREALPSYRGQLMRRWYEVDVHASIPYWPDARARFELHVRAPDRAPTVNDALLFASHAGGAPVRGPYAEVSLGTRAFAPGDVLTGAVAVFNVRQCGYDRVVVSLIEAELENGATAERAWAITLKPARFVDGERVDFSMRVPEIGPSHQTRSGVVSHRLAVTVHSTFRELVSLPIPVDVLPKSASQRATRVVHALGEERVDLVWQQLAAEEGVSFDEQALFSEVGSVRVAVRRSVSGGTPHLVAELRHPALGLELRSEPRSVLASLFGGAVTTGWRTLDRRLRCTGRSLPQTERWLRGVAAALGPQLPAKIRIEGISDTEITLALDDSGTSKPGVLQLLGPARRAAAELNALLPSVPLPPGIREHEAAWIALAQRLGASLERGSGIVARRDLGNELEIRPLLDEGALSGLRVAIVGAELALDAVTATSPEALRGFGDDAVSTAAALLQLPLGESRTLFVSDDGLVLTATHRSLEGDTPARIERALGLLGRLAEALRGNAGPFR